MSKTKTTKGAKTATEAVAPKEASAQEPLQPGDDGSNRPVYEAVCAVHGPGCASDNCPQKAVERTASGAAESMYGSTEDLAKAVLAHTAAAKDEEPLDAYIARVERAKLDQDIVAVAITHPEVHADRVHPGTYGGIRLSNGPVGVTYSDGTTA